MTDLVDEYKLKLLADFRERMTTLEQAQKELDGWLTAYFQNPILAKDMRKQFERLVREDERQKVEQASDIVKEAFHPTVREP